MIFSFLRFGEKQNREGPFGGGGEQGEKGKDADHYQLLANFPLQFSARTAGYFGKETRVRKGGSSRKERKKKKRERGV